MAIALGVEAARRRYWAVFSKVADLVRDLLEARENPIVVVSECNFAKLIWKPDTRFMVPSLSRETS